MTLIVLLLTLLLALLVAGVLYQAIGSARDTRRFPPPGKLVSIGSHRLHIHVTGEGSPTVVLDSGLPATVLSWCRVQPEVARLTRVVSYDRAGLGWSELGPLPRTSLRIVEELRALLRAAELPPPYVLVGHSFGGFTARLFAGRYPEEVAGVVLVDPIHPEEWQQPDTQLRGKLIGGARLARYGALVVRLGVGRFIALMGRLGALGAARFLVTVITGGAVGRENNRMAPASKLPEELRPAARHFWLLPKSYLALAGQVESLPESAAQVAEVKSLGDLPLRVLSGGSPGPERLARQEAAAQLSTSGKHLIAAASGHWIQLDDAEIVVEAIRQVVAAARRTRR
jgi:pimeloyl-ACP methyl ester carboxylesterase